MGPDHKLRALKGGLLHTTGQLNIEERALTVRAS